MLADLLKFTTSYLNELMKNIALEPETDPIAAAHAYIESTNKDATTKMKHH